MKEKGRVLDDWGSLSMQRGGYCHVETLHAGHIFGMLVSILDM